MLRPLLFAAGLCCLAGSLLAQPAAASRSRVTADERHQGFSSRSVLAKLKADATAAIATAAESEKGARLVRTLGGGGRLRVLDVAGRGAIDEQIRHLRQSGLYEYVEPDYVRVRHELPNDPRFVAGEQWYLRNTGQQGGTAGADIGAVQAWTTRHDAPDVIVAVIDTGVRLTHEDLATNLWTNSKEIAGNGVDDDGNGYVDDVHGINSLASLGSADSGNPDDDSGHGTRVAGLIGAAGNNSKGIAGVAWKVKIMALKFDDADGSALVSNAIECIDYAIAKGASVINFSYGSLGYSQAEYDAIKRARDAGVIVVTSAGNSSLNNDSSTSYPSNYLLDNVVAVAATDRKDALANFSNYGPGLVELAAPGAEIVSTHHLSDVAYQSANGTSFSSPITAGALALMRAQYPTDHFRGLLNRVLRSVDRLPALAGKTQTGGRLNLARALSSTTDRPFNDDFADRAAFNSSSVTLRSQNYHATAETGEPSHAGIAASQTLWWAWTAPASGSAAIETVGSGFDTTLAVSTGASLGGLTPIASNDNIPGGTASRVSFTATAGTTYQIAVGGKGGEGGPIALTVGFLPTNDQFADAIDLSNTNGRVMGSNAVAGNELGESKPDSTGHGRTVWFKWTAPATDYYSASVFAYGFDAVGAVYGGSGLGSLTKIELLSTKGYNEPAVFRGVAGTTYFIQIDSADGSSGAFDLAITAAIGFASYYAVDPSPALSPKTGRFLMPDVHGYIIALAWNSADVDLLELPGTLEAHIPAFGADGSIFIGDDDGYLTAFNPDLSNRWKKDLGLVRVTSSPAVGADGTVYVHSDDGYLHAFLPDGTRKWRASIAGESYSSPTLGADGTVYIGSDDQHLYALSPLDGSRKWAFQTDGEVYASPAIDASGVLYFGTLNGKFYAVSSDGNERWSYWAGGGISSSAAIGRDGTLYFGCYDKNVYALRATGTLKWKYATGDEIRASSPAIATDDTIYIGSYDGYLHAINANGTQKRVYATGAYIRSSPLIYDGALMFGSGDNRMYIADVNVNLANTPWPMHRQNVRRTGRVVTSAAPQIQTQPVLLAGGDGIAPSLAVDAQGGDPLAFQWNVNDAPIAAATQSAFGVSASNPAESGLYTVTVTNGAGSVTSKATIVGVTSSAKVTGAASEVGANIPHPNGNVFDQILLNGSAAAITTDHIVGQVTRTSYIDGDNDIVQVEFSGPGTLTLALDSSSTPAAPTHYNQPTVSYMKGHARIVITGATEQTNVSIFTVGRATAFDPTGHYNILLPPSATNVPATNGSSLFAGHATTVYDGVADIAYIAISSSNGKFGGIRTSNTHYSAMSGYTGIYAPGVTFTGPVFVGNIAASGTARPFLVLGSAGDTRITGGDLQQPNAKPVEVAGLTQLKFTAGSDSHGNTFGAKANQAVLQQNGVNVTAQIVVNP